METFGDTVKSFDAVLVDCHTSKVVMYVLQRVGNELLLKGPVLKSKQATFKAKVWYSKGSLGSHIRALYSIATADTSVDCKALFDNALIVDGVPGGGKSTEIGAYTYKKENRAVTITATTMTGAALSSLRTKCHPDVNLATFEKLGLMKCQTEVLIVDEASMMYAEDLARIVSPTVKNLATIRQ
jgi:hypothetical protein